MRKWRHKTTFGGQGQWTSEVGETNPTGATSDLIKENSSNVSVYFRLFLH